MSLNRALVAEFEHEMANTRKALERIPDERLEFKPHEKSFSLRDLMTHLVNLPTWGKMTLESDSLDVAPPGQPPLRATPLDSVAAALELFDQNVAASRQAIAAADDDAYRQPWTLLAGGKEVFTLPRSGVLRTMVLNHVIHHRGQLTVYLRLLDVPVPSIYGPSADEGGF